LSEISLPNCDTDAGELEFKQIYGYQHKLFRELFAF
jgi:hypothetical protein